ncbi:hypothetical protein N2152v2_001374 [Parachlorella kessleri]
MTCLGSIGSTLVALVLPLTVLTLAIQPTLASSDALNSGGPAAAGTWSGLSSRQRVVHVLHGQQWEQYSQYSLSQKTSITPDRVTTASERSRGSALDCDTLWVDQPVDHFSKEDADSPSWQQRVYVCTRFWGKLRNEPLFFYAGPEAALEKAFPSVFSDWAQQDGGLLVYAEHRYYGESMPKGASSLTSEGIQWLTAEQAVADYAAALRFVRQKYKVPSSAPAVAYGGSYGGNLAAYMRILYPDDFDVAVAAGAPVKYLAPAAPYKHAINDSFEVLTKAVQDASGSTCSKAIRLGFQTLADLADSQRGRSQLEKSVGFCTTEVLKSPESVAMLANTLRNAWWGLFQSLDVKGLAQVLLLTMSSGSSGQQYDCLPSYTTEPLYAYSQSDLQREPDSLAYFYQGCREGFPVSDFFSSSTAKGSIFGDGSLDWEAYTAWCKDLYALREGPVPPSSLVYDEDTYSSATNIVMVRKGGLRSTLLYNLLGAGEWEVLIMQAVIGMGPGGIPQSMSLLQLEEPEALSGTSAAGAAHTCLTCVQPNAGAKQ